MSELSRPSRIQAQALQRIAAEPRAAVFIFRGAHNTRRPADRIVAACVLVIAAARNDPEVAVFEIDVVSELAKESELSSCVQY